MSHQLSRGTNDARQGDIVLVGLRDYQDEKADVILKCAVFLDRLRMKLIHAALRPAPGGLLPLEKLLQKLQVIALSAPELSNASWQVHG